MDTGPKWIQTNRYAQRKLIRANRYAKIRTGELMCTCHEIDPTNRYGMPKIDTYPYGKIDTLK